MIAWSSHSNCGFNDGFAEVYTCSELYLTMVATEVYNATSGDLSLKEGNAGVYRDIKLLGPKKKHVIEIDPNATYREYVVVSAPGGDKVFVTSDDCIDNAKITILVKDGKYTFEGEGRDDQGKKPEQANGGFLSRILKRIWK